MADQTNETPQNDPQQSERQQPESTPVERANAPREDQTVSHEWDRPTSGSQERSEPNEPRDANDPSEPKEPVVSNESNEPRPVEQPTADTTASSQSVTPSPSSPQQQQDQRRDQRYQGQNRNQRGQRNNYRNRPDNRNRPERNEQRENRPEDTDSEPERQERPERFERPERMERPERQDRSERQDRPERYERNDRQQQGRNREPYQDRRSGGRQQERGSDRSSLHGSDISVVIPLYNEEGSLRELADQLKNVLSRAGQYEIIFVDDGSTDGSFRVLMDLRTRDKKIKIIRFRRNYGKSAALSVGFRQAKGDIIITMDADLQDDPAEIPNLVNEIKKGYDLVSGWKKKRHDPITKTIPSKFFNFVTSKMTGVKLHDMNCGLKAYRKEAVKDLKIYGELHRYIPALAKWQGFKIGEVVVQHHPRKFGKTKFGIGRFWKGFLDLLTVLFTTRYLQRPLHLFGFWGGAFFTVGFVIDAYLTYLKFVDGLALSNRPLFLGGILMIIVGIQFVSVGLIGELITKTRSTNEEEYSVKEFWR